MTRKRSPSLDGYLAEQMKSPAFRSAFEKRRASHAITLALNALLRAALQHVRWMETEERREGAGLFTDSDLAIRRALARLERLSRPRAGTRRAPPPERS
jgi:hypothetical protein